MPQASRAPPRRLRSAVRADFDPARNDVDLLVEFDPGERPMDFADLREALEIVFGRRVDLVDRAAIEQSRNSVRRRMILAEAVGVYGG